MTIFQDIRVSLSNKPVSLPPVSYQALLLAEHTDAIDPVTLSRGDSLDYLLGPSPHPAKDLFAAFFAQDPSPETLLFAAKGSSEQYPASLDRVLQKNSNFWLVLLQKGDSKSDQESIKKVATWVAKQQRFLLVRSGEEKSSLPKSPRLALIAHPNMQAPAKQIVFSSIRPFVKEAKIPFSTNSSYNIYYSTDGNDSTKIESVQVSPDQNSSWSTLVTKINSAISGKEFTCEIRDGTLEFASKTKGEKAFLLIHINPLNKENCLLGAISNLINIDLSILGSPQGYFVYPDAAWGAKSLASFAYKTWKWKSLILPDSSTWSTDKLHSLRANQINAIQAAGSLFFTNDCVATDGSFINTTFAMDFVKDKISFAILQLLLSRNSVSLDDCGIAQVEDVLRGVLNQMGQMGIIAALHPDSSPKDKAKSDLGVYLYKLSLPKRSEIPLADRSQRTLSGVRFSYTLSGDIHKVDVVGNLLI